MPTILAFSGILPCWIMKKLDGSAVVCAVKIAKLMVDFVELISLSKNVSF